MMGIRKGRKRANLKRRKMSSNFGGKNMNDRTWNKDKPEGKIK